MSVSRSFTQTLVLAGLTAGSAASYAETQCFNASAPNPLEACVTDTGRPSVWLDQAGNRAWQYFGQSDWGSVIFLDGVNALARYSTGYGGSPTVAPVSNVRTGSGTAGDPYTITTITTLGSSGVQFTQIFSYVNGDRQILKRWELENTGSNTFNDLRFFHGGDSYFGGIDSARSWYDANNSMVYISNDSFAATGYMGFYANPATPASAYFAGFYSAGNQQALTGQLSSTADANYQDAGYYLQWNRASLAPGARWAVEATEIWSDPGALQVFAPANDSVVPGQTITRSFSIQNFNAGSDVNAELALNSLPAGWSASIVSPASPVALSPLASQTVVVNITVAQDASPGDVQDIVLSATAGGVTNQASLRLEVAAMDFAISPAALDFGNVTVGNTVQQTISLSNGAGSLPLDVASLIHSLGAEFSLTADTCSNTTLPAAGACTVTLQYAPTQVGAANATLTFPFTAPVTTTRSVTITGAGVTAPPVIPTAAVPVPIAGAAGAASLGVLGLAAWLGLRRRNKKDAA